MLSQEGGQAVAPVRIRCAPSPTGGKTSTDVGEECTQNAHRWLRCACAPNRMAVRNGSEGRCRSVRNAVRIRCTLRMRTEWNLGKQR